MHKRLLFLAVFSSTCVFADDTWTGTVDGNWNTAGNWLDGTVPVNSQAAGNTVTIGSAPLTFLPTNHNRTSGDSITGLIINGTPASPIVIGGNAIGFGAGGINMSAAGVDVTFNNIVNINAGGGVWNVPTGRVLTFLDVNNGGGVSTTGAGTIRLTGSADNGGFVMTAAGTNIVELDKASTASVHAVGGAGTVLTINSGATVRNTGTGGDQIYTQGDVVVNTGGTYDLNARSEGFDALSGGGLINNTTATAVTLTLGEHNNGSTYTGGIQNTGGGALTVVKTGTGQQNLNGAVASTFTGGVTVSNGILGITADNRLGATSGALTLNGGMLINNTAVDVTVDAARPVVLGASGGRQRVSNNRVFTMAAAVSGAGTYRLVNDGGNFVLSNPANSWAGHTYIGGNGSVGGWANTAAAATLRLGASDVLPNGAGKGDLFFDAGVEGATTLNATLNMQGFNETINGLGHTSGNAFIQNQAAATTSTLTVGDNNATATFNGILRNNSGAGGTLAFTKIGTGTQTIGGTSANTYTGLTSVNGGTLVLNKTGGITAIGGNLTIGDGTGTDTVRLNNVNQIVDTSNIILNAGGVLNLNGNVETVATVNGAATSAIQNTSASPTTLTLTSGTMAGTISNSGGGALGITKNGAGTLALSNAGNSYTGKTVINGGTLEINTGNEATLGANPAAFASDHFTLSSGTLRIMGSSITIDDSNRGISLGAGSSSTIDVDSGLVANVLNMISGGSADLNKNGTGTLNLTSDNQLSKLFVNNGTLTQSGGSIKLNSASGGTVLAGATYNLSGGTLRTDSLNNAGTLNWNAILTGKQTQAGTANGTDWTLNPAASSGPVVQTGTKILGSGTLNTGAGAVLNLDGLYLSTSVLVDRLEMAGTLDLSLAGDTLDWNDSTVYLLRPFGFFTEDYGSIPLVAASSITGTFNTFNGLTADSRGFTTLASIIGGLPIDPSTLGTNEGLLQYADNVVNPAGFAPGTYDIIYFHYKVAGFVPEPDTFAFLALGVIGLRTARRMKALRDRLS